MSSGIRFDIGAELRAAPASMPQCPIAGPAKGPRAVTDRTTRDHEETGLLPPPRSVASRPTKRRWRVGSLREPARPDIGGSHTPTAGTASILKPANNKTTRRLERRT